MNPLPYEILFIHSLQNDSAATFNYMSFALALIVFIVGLYCMAKKKKYGVYLLVSSVLLLINPAISMFL